jgi:hypothetical protein
VVKKELQGLTNYEYSKVIFCGHGWHSSTVNSTMIQLNKSESIDSKELRTGSRKQTIILDSCRQIERLEFSADLLERMVKSAARINPDACRRSYDKRIEECASAVVVMFACDINETAGEESRGGYYSHNLLHEAEKWAQANPVDVNKSHDILSVVAAHNAAIPQVRALSGGRQNPQLEKPRAEKYFPFGVVA